MPKILPIKLESKFIAIEGPVGSGKTSLAKKLADYVDGKLILEQPEENPFLLNFYTDPRSNALPTELSFLFQRSKLLEQVNQEELFSSITVTDFLFDKDVIFSEMNLTMEELELFNKVKESLHIKPQTPDLVIYLQAPVDVLISRIKMRSSSVDGLIDPRYLKTLADSYTKFFYHYDDAPLLVVNAESIDPIHNNDHFEMLFKELSSVKFGTHFFNNTASVLR
jgi:deoxyguanosine kinase